MPDALSGILLLRHKTAPPAEAQQTTDTRPSMLSISQTIPCR
ncbi:hypothetical protein HMPREF0758_4640 [Serratia odorifera DSM 4582]|uniref:Uncharacterized protein n=1 Tax=Serratia odorifera DSM 4582 TaxID=667129 RepID=D4E8Z0_SEROD|nr:hypothetical protein HMPREF0758_4640 [Serratia odorifera DSM 4582]